MTNSISYSHPPCAGFVAEAATGWRLGRMSGYGAEAVGANERLRAGRGRVAPFARFATQIVPSARGWRHRFCGLLHFAPVPASHLGQNGGATKSGLLPLARGRFTRALPRPALRRLCPQEFPHGILILLVTDLDRLDLLSLSNSRKLVRPTSIPYGIARLHYHANSFHNSENWLVMRAWLRLRVLICYGHLLFLAFCCPTALM